MPDTETFEQIKSEFGQTAAPDNGSNDPAVNNMNQSQQMKPGYQTSQFQLTAAYTLISMIFGFTKFDWGKNPENWENLAAVVIPFLTSGFAIVKYIESRGKLASNTVNANAQLAMVTQAANSPHGFANLGGILGKIFGTASAVAPIIPGKTGDIVGTVASVGQNVTGTLQNPTGPTNQEIYNLLQTVLSNQQTMAGNDTVIYNDLQLVKTKLGL